LEKYHFKRVTLSSYSLGEQASLFANAKIIVAPHGAGLANLLFCKPETLLMELHFPTYTKALYWRLASALGLRYAAFLGEPCLRDPANMIIPKSALESFIAQGCALDQAQRTDQKYGAMT
jgi:capsular polysaccharide biosynthesis protein